MCARRSVAELVNTEIFRCIVVVAWQECECVYPQDPPAQQTYPFTAEAASGSARSIRTRITFILFQSNLYFLFAPSVFASSQHTRCLHTIISCANVFVSLDRGCGLLSSVLLALSGVLFPFLYCPKFTCWCGCVLFASFARWTNPATTTLPPHPLSPIQPKPNRL